MNMNYIQVDSYQNFSSGILGQVLTSSQLTTGTIGGGTWDNQAGANESWFLTGDASVSYCSLIKIDSNIINQTGPYWSQYNHGAGVDETNWMSFRIGPFAGSSDFGVNDNVIITAFYKFGAFNETANTQRNLDHFETQGSPFGIMQQQLGGQNGFNNLMTHSQLDNGSSSNGGFIPIQKDKLYWIVYTRDRLNAIAKLDVYDPINWSLVGHSESEIGINFNFWWIRFQAHYYEGNPGDISGYTRMGGLTISYSNSLTTLGSPRPCIYNKTVLQRSIKRLRYIRRLFG